MYILPQWELALSCIPQNAHKRPSYFCQSAALNNTGAFQANTTNQNMSAAFEWALLDSEVVPVQNIMQKYNWTQTALHHHMLGESPKILFLHWSVTGNANDLINQAKEIITQTSTYDTQQPRAPSSAGP